MRTIISLLALLLWVFPAQALLLDVQITPVDGFVTVGQEVGMVLTVTNDSSDPRQGLTIINTNDIDGLSFPMEVAPCVLGVAQLNRMRPPQPLLKVKPTQVKRAASNFVEAG